MSDLETRIRLVMQGYLSSHPEATGDNLRGAVHRAFARDHARGVADHWGQQRVDDEITRILQESTSPET